MKVVRADRRCIIVWSATAGSVPLSADQSLDCCIDFDPHVGCADYTEAGKPQAAYRAHPSPVGLEYEIVELACGFAGLV